ncbi:MAG: UbiX family flavin prenyltransferase [Thermodesulfobacteriota bacterium]|nr:UbiX family flavin prenyltransferase [Thermodesulfobacteriota bacterium]
MKVLLGISGASGAVYGVRTGAALNACRVDLHLVVTATAWDILEAEIGTGNVPRPGSARGTGLRGMGLPGRKRWLAERMSVPTTAFHLYAEDDFSLPFASGSNPPDAMIIAPCSMGMLGRIAHGISSSVLSRCADVALKERRPLVVVPREAPLSAVHLENMLTLARVGADILPASPGFYHRPATVAEMVDFVVSRILRQIGIDAGLTARWGEIPGRAKTRERGSRRKT